MFEQYFNCPRRRSRQWKVKGQLSSVRERRGGGGGEEAWRGVTEFAMFWREIFKK